MRGSWQAAAHYAPLVLDAVLGLLRCPHCGAQLARRGGVVLCAHGHSYDVARQGYLSLLPGDAQLGSADSAAMVAARERFLGAGWFEPLASALACTGERLLARSGPGLVIDLGAGTGFYLARVLDRLPDRVGLALDLSKHALRRAARAHERIGAVAADSWRPLPVRDGVAALALSVFAPRAGAEIARALAPGGALVVATPTERHLAELVSALDLVRVDERKAERLAQNLEPHLDPVARSLHEWTLELGHAQAQDLVLMGPSGVHVDPAALATSMAALPELLRVCASVHISVYRRAG